MQNQPEEGAEIRLHILPADAIIIDDKLLGFLIANYLFRLRAELTSTIKLSSERFV